MGMRGPKKVHGFADRLEFVRLRLGQHGDMTSARAFASGRSSSRHTSTVGLSEHGAKPRSSALDGGTGTSFGIRSPRGMSSADGRSRRLRRGSGAV
jgi:hypothetical protein